MGTNAYYLNQFISTTLATVGGIDDSQTTGIILTSVTGVETTKPGIVCLSYSDPIDTSKAEWISYTSISVTNELQGVTRGAEGFSAKSHSNGVTIAFPISESHINNLNDALIIGGSATNLATGVIDDDTFATASATKLATSESIKAYSDSATQTLTNKTLTSPKINEDVALTATATQLNAQVLASNDGWISANETWTYASATTITVPSGATNKYQKGDKIKLTQTTVKYFYIVGVADTLLTITGGSSYTLTNATITANYYSHASSPIGFPGSFTYTPVLSANGGTLPTFSQVNGRFFISGGICHYNFFFSGDGGTSGSGTNDLILSIPISQLTVSGSLGQVSWYGTGTTQGNGIIMWNTATTVGLRKDITSPLTLDVFPSGVRYLQGVCDLYL